jgi:hypothetical protein
MAIRNLGSNSEVTMAQNYPEPATQERTKGNGEMVFFARSTVRVDPAGGAAR